MIKKIDEQTKTVYFSNNIENDDIKKMAKIIKQLGKVSICFSVIGRTEHERLGNELIRKLKEKRRIIGHTDYQSYKVVIELEKRFRAVFQFQGAQGIRYYKDQYNNWYGVIDGEINFCCHWDKGIPPQEKLEFDRQEFDVELLEAN